MMESNEEVEFSVAAGAKEVTTGVGFAGYTYMQDIDKSTCDSITTGTGGRLIDRRDGKIYWVAKLKNSVDDNALCWMTQNLDYDGGAVEGYSGTDTVTLEIGTLFAANTQDKKIYYDPGEYIYVNKSMRTECKGINMNTGLSACTDKGWKLKSDLVDSTWTMTTAESFYSATSYVATDGITICNKTANSWLGDMTSDYIPCRIYGLQYILDFEHYLAGNYYNWMAATNGTGNSATSDGAPASGSICPIGWSLPLSGNNNDGNDGSFYKLASGLSSGQFALTPYYFVYSGSVSGTNLSVGSFGQYWSAVSGSNNYAYRLNFSNSIVPSYSYDRYYGLSVRCVAR